MAIMVLPLDDVMQRYANALAQLGEGNAHKAMARAINYEGKRAFVQVKRALRKQTSIPYVLINKGVKTKQARPKVGSALEFAILGTGRHFPLKIFKPRQFAAGTKATVWGRRQLFPGGFMGPRPGVLAPRLYGNVYRRASPPDRKPIEMMWGPSIPVELVKDQSAQAFYSALPRILDRAGKEIAAVLRGL